MSIKMDSMTARSFIEEYLAKNGNDRKNVQIGIYGLGMSRTGELVKQAMDQNQKIIFENDPMIHDEVTFKFVS